MANYTGEYSPNHRIKVTHFPSPNVEGDAEEVKDNNGRTVTDDNGRPVRRHSVPEGFEARHTRSENGVVTSENYARVDSRGEVVRDPQGNAHSLREGYLLVEHPDGHVEYVHEDEAEDYLRGYGQGE